MNEKVFRLVCIAVIIVQFIISMTLRMQLEDAEKRIDVMEKNQIMMVDSMKGMADVMKKIAEAK